MHMCIGIHEVASRFAEAICEPLDELGRVAGLGEGRLRAALASETILSLVPEVLDRASGEVGAHSDGFLRSTRLRCPSAANAFPIGGTRRLPWSTPPSDRSPARCLRLGASSERL